MSNSLKIENPSSRAKKMMLWIAMISMSMTFAGLTSAYVVSSKRADWLRELEIPVSFTISTIIILISGFTFWYAKRQIKIYNKIKSEDSISTNEPYIVSKRGSSIVKSQTALFLTLALSLAFVFFQFRGFNQIIEQGYYFTGPESSITSSYIYILVLLHLAHLFVGIIVLVVVLINNHRNKYLGNDTTGLGLASNFWHFLDVLWIYLYLFVIFVG